MNRRIAGSLSLAALAIALVACGGGTSGKDKTSTAAAHSATPAGGSPTASASKTAGATSTSKTAAPGTMTPGTTANQTAVAADTAAAGSPDTGSPSPQAPAADVTVNADGTATNPQGTPVPLPTTGAAATPVAGASPQPAATPGSGKTRIFLEAPTTASGDFTVNVRVDGVTDGYKAFNLYLTFDASVVEDAEIHAGTALAATSDEMFCAKPSPNDPGSTAFGCTILGSGVSTNNGILATINYHKVGPGTVVLHLQSLADGGSSHGTYIATIQGGTPKAVAIELDDATVTVS